MKMVITLKANNQIINNYYADYKGCVIEQEQELIPLQRTADNFEPPKGGVRKIYYHVRFKGYQNIFSLDVYKSDNKENCIKYIEQFFDILEKIPQDITNYIYINLDKAIKL